jgi:hypothetical protein
MLLFLLSLKDLSALTVAERPWFEYPWQDSNLRPMV